MIYMELTESDLHTINNIMQYCMDDLQTFDAKSILSVIHKVERASKKQRIDIAKWEPPVRALK